MSSIRFGALCALALLVTACGANDDSVATTTALTDSVFTEALADAGPSTSITQDQPANIVVEDFPATNVTSTFALITGDSLTSDATDSSNQSGRATTTEATTTQVSTNPSTPTTAALETTVSTTTTTAAKQTTTRPLVTTTTPQPSRSVAYRGVTPGQWDEIDGQRARFGDPNNCKNKIASISNNTGVVVSPEDSNGITQALESGANVVRLEGGTHSISKTIQIGDGQQLIGIAGQNVTIAAGGVRRAVQLNNNAVLANVTVTDAENDGVVLGSSSLVYQVSVGRTGYGPTVNSNGAGLSVSRDGANNCIVSAEAFDGFNEDGASCEPCFNGGNADGVAIKFGARNNTVIDTHSYRNSDDGYDFWEGGTTFVYFGSAFDNGKTPNRASGDGNGLKLGRGQAKHYLYKTKAYQNRANGIDLNGNSVPADLVQTESSNNGAKDYVNVANS